MAKNEAFPDRQFRAQAAELLAGGLKASALAKELGVARRDVEGWAKEFRGKVGKRKQSAREQKLALNLLRAVSAREQSKQEIARLRSALKQDHKAKSKVAKEQTKEQKRQDRAAAREQERRDRKAAKAEGRAEQKRLAKETKGGGRELRWPGEFRRKAVQHVLNGPMEPGALAAQLDIPAEALEGWVREERGKLKPKRWGAEKARLSLELLRTLAERVRTQARIAAVREQTGGRKDRGPKRGDVVGPSKAYQKRLVSLSLNGGVRLEYLAQELKLPLSELREWRRHYAAETKHWPLTATEVMDELKNLKQGSPKAPTIASLPLLPFDLLTNGSSSSSSSSKPHPVGFDISTYPGDDKMTNFFTPDTPFSFTGFYLAPAPAHSDTSWMSKRETLLGIGYGFAVTYLGHQKTHLTYAQGQTDAVQAASLATTAGFTNEIIYLDWEAGGTVSPSGIEYITGWLDQIVTTDFGAGIYCSYLAAPQIKAARSSLPVRFWVYRLSGKSPGCKSVDLGGLKPSDSGVSFASVWQYAQTNSTRTCSQTWNGTTLKVDLNVANTKNPSAR